MQIYEVPVNLFGPETYHLVNNGSYFLISLSFIRTEYIHTRVAVVFVQLFNLYLCKK